MTKLGDDADPAIVRRLDEGLEILRHAVGWIDPAIVGDVVAVVA